MITIDLINEAPHIVSDQEIVAMMPALQEYHDKYLKPAWDFDEASMHFVSQGHKADPRCWWIVFGDKSDDPGALGYHDIHPDGKPYSRIFAGDDKRCGASLSVTTSHEWAEMMGDPTIDKMFDTEDGKKWIVELCDAVEDDSQAIDVGGYKMSNFVLPSYFKKGAPGPYDLGGHLTGPCPILTAGGYLGFFQDGQWSQVTARMANGQMGYRSMRQSGRSQRRATV